MQGSSRISSFAPNENRLHFKIDQEHISVIEFEIICLNKTTIFQTESKQSNETSSTTSKSSLLENTTGTTASSRRLGQKFIILHYSPFKAVYVFDINLTLSISCLILLDGIGLLFYLFYIRA